MSHGGPPGSGMAPERVARLANDIAAQFPHLPNDAAAKETARMITTFWEPRMRAELASIAGRPDSGLSIRAEAAAALLG